ncbi:MAG TPA: transglycosylase SLT domain-containing protein [Bacteroidales bacterium]|nr:transglycosylase SLT domain-containing protein [Bacteroidales bacterium]
MKFRILQLLVFYFFSFASLASMPDDKDMLYEYRIARLNTLSPVPLDYNAEVRKYIDLFTGPRKSEMATVIGLSRIYFPLFDEILDRYSLPYELKYLTIVESGLNPLAVSKSGAVGLWQFLLNTSRLFDLQVTSYIDERRDPWKSTEAACIYLGYLYNTFHDWQLVLSSYNGGPGEVRKAIERCNGETSYWKLRPYLSEQAQNYVPAFIAAIYVMNYYKDHDIVPVEPAYDYSSLDTLHIRYPVTFEQISAIIDLPVDRIRWLNPVYRTDYIPGQQPWTVLALPSEKAQLYIRYEINILGYSAPANDYNLMVRNAGSTEGRTKIIHEVKPGEFTHRIAMKYNCTLENIKAWNNLSGYELMAGQKLVIWVKNSDE